MFTSSLKLEGKRNLSDCLLVPNGLVRVFQKSPDNNRVIYNSANNNKSPPVKQQFCKWKRRVDGRHQSRTARKATGTQVNKVTLFTTMMSWKASQDAQCIEGWSRRPDPGNKWIFRVLSHINHYEMIKRATDNKYCTTTAKFWLILYLLAYFPASKFSKDG